MLDPTTHECLHYEPLGGHPPLTSDVTEIFLPSFLAHGGKVAVAGLPPGASAEYDEARQTLYVRTPGARPGTVHAIRGGHKSRRRRWRCSTWRSQSAEAAG